MNLGMLNPLPAATWLILALSNTWAVEHADTVLNLWPDQPPGEAMEVGPEKDFTKPTDRLIAGRRIIKLGNVTTPQIHVFQPEPTRNTGASVVICPGGGFHILAWDLEGTEVAEWLNSIGVTAVVLKYRVPTADQDPRWLAPVQDAQRAIRLTRHHADAWQLDTNRVGILGFSAGGNTAGRATLMQEAQYEPLDKADEHAFHPNFAVLVYAAGMANKDNTALLEDLPVSERTPPIFFAHAFDDRVRIENSLLLALEMKKHDVPCELHVYSEGGHGYGLRVTDQPVTTWHHRCADWMQVNGWVGKVR
jgi:acetyl esterase/lipase